MSHYDTLLSLIVSGLDGKNGKITVTCAQKASALNDVFSVLFSLGIPGVNLWKVKVNGTFSSEMLIPPTIASMNICRTRENILKL
jgi:hypothetical protein